MRRGNGLKSRPAGSTDIAISYLTLPNQERSIKFAIIGDSGRGSKEQHEIAAQMVAYRQRFDYKFVLMAGDNIYEGPATEEDYRLKFEEPYKLLLDAGVKFYAALGNHDDTNQIFYKPFNMDGRRYYTFVPPVDPITRWDTRVRFFALDSTYLSLEQIRWFEKEVTESRAEWKIAFLHHPLYTSGRYTLAARGVRLALESAFVNGGVDVVFSGHEHIYERAELQGGILYFITGGAGSLRAGDAAPSPRRAQLRPGLSLHAGRDCRRWILLPGDQPHGRDGRCGLAAASYCGHDGPSVTCLTLPLNTRTHSAMAVECLASIPVG